MSCRRLALAPLVALLLSGLVGGSAAHAATSSTAEPTATSAANKKSSSKKKSSGKKKSSKKKSKKKKVTVSSLDKRLKRTEKDLKAARNQIRTVQRATASLVGGLDTVAGASGSIDAAMAGFQAAIVGSAAQELAKFQAALDASIQQQAALNSNLIVTALANPGVKPQVEQLLTGIFGVSPTVIGQSIADLGPAVQKGLTQLVVREQPVLFVRIGSKTSSAVVGGDLPDDGNPLSVSGSVMIENASGPVELLAGVRSDEGDSPAAKVVLDTLEAQGAVSGGTTLGDTHAVAGNGTVVPVNRIERTSPASTLPGTNIAQGSLTASGTVLVRFTARFTDDSTND